MDDFSWLNNIKPVAATAVLVLLWIVEALAPMFPGYRQRLRHDAANVALGVLNAVVIAALFGAAMLYVTEWARFNRFGLLHWFSFPSWLTWLLAVILLDAWMYTWHVLNHKVPLLWRFHAVHHADREMDASSALRFHTGEIVLSASARLTVLPLLGVTMPQLLLYDLLLQPVILFHHSNVRMPRRLDQALRCVIVTPWMHWVHHSNWRPETDSNFSSVFSVWDRLFGTFRLRQNPRTIQLGLNDDLDERSWRTLPGMFMRPFRLPAAQTSKEAFEDHTDESPPK